MSNRTAGLISVVIPVFNRPAQLRDAVASVLAQDYRPIEVIIVDDGSTDGETRPTAENLVSAFSSELRLITQENGGPGAAREAGRKVARGEYIQYLDSDDVLLPGKFSFQIEALLREPKADVAYGITYFRASDGHLSEVPLKGTGVPRSEMFPSFLECRWWDTSTPIYRAAICDRAGDWTNLRVEEDWEYDCRIAANGGRLTYCPIPVSETRDHSGTRLSRPKVIDGARLRMRAHAHSLIWLHAQKAGLWYSAPAAVDRFAQALFLLSRQCGAAGLERESRQLHDLATGASAKNGRVEKQLRRYKWLAGRVGWTTIGRLSHHFDRLRELACASWRALVKKPC